MSLLSLIYGTNKRVKIAEIEVDVSIAESHETDCDITENPVESGANITDHVQVKPAKLTIEGLISDTPIKFFQGIRSLFDDNRSRKTYEELVAIQQEREPIDIVTGLKKYSNMILKTLTVPRNADTGKALRFNAMFQEIIIVESTEISVTTTDSKFQRKSSIGKNTAKTPIQDTLEKANSLLSRITGLGG